MQYSVQLRVRAQIQRFSRSRPVSNVQTSCHSCPFSTSGDLNFFKHPKYFPHTLLILYFLLLYTHPRYRILLLSLSLSLSLAFISFLFLSRLLSASENMIYLILFVSTPSIFPLFNLFFFFNTRALCTRHIGDWLPLDPVRLYKDDYLKYIGWMCFDYSAAVRKEAVRSVGKLLKVSQFTFHSNYIFLVIHQSLVVVIN